MSVKLSLVVAMAGSMIVASPAVAGLTQPAVANSTTQSWYSLKYYITPDATKNSGRAMVVERKGPQIYITIVTMQGTPACFHGTRTSKANYSGTLDGGYPPYKNWTLTLTPTGGGVTLTQRHSGGFSNTERYRRATKVGIKQVFNWNAWKLHQQYQRQCRF